MAMRSPSGHQAAIRPYPPQLMVEQAAQGVEEQSPRAGVAAGGKGAYLVPCVSDARAPEQRVPVVVEVARIAGQRFIRSLAVQHHFDAVGLGQLHEVEARDRRSRDDRLLLEPDRKSG